jgi:hypothetical protein
VDPNVPYKKVHAMRGKYLRAQPVGMLMEQGRIHHAGTAEDFERLEDQLCAITEDSDRSKAHDDRADAHVYAITELRGAIQRQFPRRVFYGQMRGLQKVYRDDQAKCPKCGLEREVFDRRSGRKGRARTVQERLGGEGLAGWREVYSDESPDAVFDRQHKILQQVMAMQAEQMAGPRQNWAGIWKRGRYIQ